MCACNNANTIYNITKSLYVQMIHKFCSGPGQISLEINFKYTLISLNWDGGCEINALLNPVSCFWKGIIL